MRKPRFAETSQTPDEYMQNNENIQKQRHVVLDSKLKFTCEDSDDDDMPLAKIRICKSKPVVSLRKTKTI